MSLLFTAIIEREGDWYVTLCPELDIASQGQSVEEARNNLVEAIELFLETASPSEIKDRLLPDHDELQIGTLRSIIRQSQLPRALFEAQ